jgi:hypothetical protein
MASAVTATGRKRQHDARGEMGGDSSGIAIRFPFVRAV